ncbi:MAG: [protein-PII] uridylyltransferase [Verrucomicrobia bacterium]|nr:[protein-PII] uridylyltransferase [Verrucomicrobiota bacterium]
MPSLLEKIESSAATRLAVPGNRKPSEELPRFKNFLKVETHRLKMLHRAGASGHEICHARATILDALLCYILKAARNSTPKTDKMPDFAMVALGGFGRSELNPYSDIDIMFLHDGKMVSRGKPVPSLTALNESMLYTLWDIGVKVGHSVRNIDECVKLANEDMQSKTSLIEARLICGSAKLFERFQKTILAKCVAGHENEYVQQRLQDQAARRAKFGNSPLLQEPNIKNGCGGLRDFQNLIWMTFFKYRTRSLRELQEKEMISPAERKQLEAAYDFLLRTRNELHYHVGRPVDVLTKSVQPSVANYLGYTDRSPSLRLEKFMRVFYTHTRNIDLITRTVEQRLALVPQKTFLPSFRRMLNNQREKMRAQIVDGFKLLDGEIMPATSFVFRDRPWRLMRVFLYAQQRNLKLHPDLAQMIRNQLHLVDNSFLRDAHVRETFLEILDQRGNVAPVLRQMHEVGLLGKFLPEFGKLTCLVQHEFYHQYTADEHTLVCIEKLDRVWGGEEAPFAGYTELFQSIERPFVLYLALLLHDAGKAYEGKGKRHEEIGRELAGKVARRLGIDGATTHILSLLIEQHLTMAVISQRRDLDDPVVIRNFGGTIQTTENLDLLTLHTFADSMGTSDQLWNSFKDSLLHMLYIKTRDFLLGGTTMIRAEAKQRELLADEVRRMMPKTFTEEELQGHFENLPARYFQINSAREIVADLTQVHRFMHLQLSDKEEALAPIIDWRNEPDRGYTLVKVCTWDREGLFTNITGSLSAAGLNILAAEIMTRADRIVLDSFFVTDAQTGLLAKREEKEAFEKLLEEILLGGEVDLTGSIARQKRNVTTYNSVEDEKIKTIISFDNESSETQTVIDVETEDKIGLLYTISQRLTELEINVSLAKIVTEKGAAIDSFYVTDQFQNKLLDPDQLKHIERKLRRAIDRLGK